MWKYGVIWMLLLSFSDKIKLDQSREDKKLAYVGIRTWDLGKGDILSLSQVTWTLEFHLLDSVGKHFFRNHATATKSVERVKRSGWISRISTQLNFLLLSCFSEILSSALFDPSFKQKTVQITGIEPRVDLMTSEKSKLQDPRFTERGDSRRWAMVVVKWSTCSASNLPYRVWIPLKLRYSFSYNLGLKRTKINKKRPGIAPF